MMKFKGMTAAAKAAILEGIEMGLTIQHAVARAGVGRRTFYDYARRGQDDPESEYAEFAMQVEQARGLGAARCFKHVNAAAESGQWQAAAFVLERSYGYRKTDGLELTGRDGGPVEHTASPTPEQIREALDKVPPVELEAALRRAKGE